MIYYLLNYIYIEWSFGFILAIILSHILFPFTRPFTTKCLFLSNIDPKTQLATISIDDSYFVGFWIVVLTFLRALFVDNLLVIMAESVYGIKSRKTKARFAEQGFALLSYGIFWAVGFALLYESPYWLSAKDLWIGWPHYLLTPSFKAFYLIQLAAWLQQIYVINIEERRKDHFQMFTHHIVTCALIIGSYYYYFTRVGLVILVIMDVVDISLSLAKVLRYIGFQRSCDALFLIFLVSWIIFRHGMYNYILWSAISDGRVLIEPKCYYEDANGIEPGKLIRCFNPSAYWILVGLLGLLQCICIVWMYMIIRVLIRLIKGDAANDSRSDDDDDGDSDLGNDDEKKKHKKKEEEEKKK